HVEEPEAEQDKVTHFLDEEVSSRADDTMHPGTVQEGQSYDRVDPARHQANVEARQAKMREVHLKLRTPNGLSDLEREPAYKRKQVTLNDGPHSQDTGVSRYTLNEEVDEHGERKVELRRNNPYLHDNVD
ncbi:MAG: hypothetical protein KDB87_11550, partial [Flavobacteriales bacterium]|nr:hypothetical protein [Flavobacteriales bacterium]